MYLTAQKFVSGYDFNKDENFSKILALLNLDEGDAERLINVDVTVGYWRKANAIHDWFVQNTQGGEDNCSRSFVSRENLAELRKECVSALKEYNDGNNDAAAGILPPSEGFFFGGTDIDEYYKRDLENTIKIIDKVLGEKFKGFDFYYQASW